MKKINFNIKDRKVLITTLSLAIICIFTLTVAYSALSAVLTIQGNARVSAADWDIYLNNPRVSNGSATTNVPEIKTSSTLEFSTTLNMPGDFYEFVVDVVNSGDIDAMIENVVKTPDLTAEQAKFLKYEVSYQNGEAITTKQTLAKDTTMPIKVRVEYRKDLVASDLPTGQVVLDLSLTLEYIQSDGTGSNVKDNGVYINPVSANGAIGEIGTIVTIASEQFYTFGTEGDNVKLLSMMNITLDDNPVQSEDAGRCPYATSDKQGIINSDYVGSIVEGHVNNYKNLLESNFGVEIVEARLITYDELVDSKTFNCYVEEDEYCGYSPYSWIYSVPYWTGTASDGYSAWYVGSSGGFGSSATYVFDDYGVRPVILISKDYFN